MIVAKAYPEPEKLKRAGSDVEKFKIDPANLSRARTVLKKRPDLADLVIG
jgi:hypothetical protein